MLTVYSDDHHLHHGRCELIDGQLMPCFEMPSRADHVLARVHHQALGPVSEPEDFGLEPIRRIHDNAYLEFFKGAWERWAELGQDGDLLPFTWPARTATTVSTAAHRSPPAPGKPRTAQPRSPLPPRPRSSKAPTAPSPSADHQGITPPAT